MADLIAYAPGTHDNALRGLMTAYLSESTELLERVFGFVEDVPAVVEDTMRHLDQFAPPTGRLLLVVDGDAIVGCGGLRKIGPGEAEVKRMYLDPAARGQGQGRRLLEALIAGAREQGCRAVFLDTDGLMPAAVELYRRAGFVPCAPYPASDIPVEFHDRWLFMRRNLADAPTASA
jgi:GNAT superfamily N-acetyltransferase